MEKYLENKRKVNNFKINKGVFSPTMENDDELL